MSHPKFTDPSVPLNERVADLLSHLTTAEKIDQLSADSPAIPRLDIPAYHWWNEALHGVARAGLATVFPQAIAMAATFDPDLVFQIAEAISDEARAKYNAVREAGSNGKYRGLTFWSPNINIFRDPRWGRGQETFGEDPQLTTAMGMAFMRGLQGNEKGRLKTAACAKHFAVHSGPEKQRHSFNAQVSQYDLWDTYLPAFQALVQEGNVAAVMGAYNRTNGEPCCASPTLLQDILRHQWGFAGHVVSDCWALADLHLHHRVTETPAEAAALALKNGCDLNCGVTFPFLSDALEQGLVTEDDIDTAFTRLLTTRFQLGLFDPTEHDPYAHLGPEVIHCPKHQDLAYRAAVSGMVLLKNLNNTLPLRPDLQNLYVVGPYATDAYVLMGNYYGVSDHMVTFLEGIVHEVSPVTSILYHPGFLPAHESANPSDWVYMPAADADATVVFAGLSGLLESEEGDAIASPCAGDREDIDLPEHQLAVIRELRAQSSKPLIVVLTGGSPICSPELHDLADAILMAWYPGEQGGAALADILFGKISPSGRLPVTFPYSLEDLPPYEDYSMQGRTYRYLQKEPLYPFGFGLTYGSIQYLELTLDYDAIGSGENVTLSVSLNNSGDGLAREVVQLYLSCLEDVPVPHYALIDFRSITLAPGKVKQILFQLPYERFSLVSQDGSHQVITGLWQITVGGSSPGHWRTELGIAVPLTTSIQILDH